MSQRWLVLGIERKRLRTDLDTVALIDGDTGVGGTCAIKLAKLPKKHRSNVIWALSFNERGQRTKIDTDRTLVGSLRHVWIYVVEMVYRR
jgi:hypothetical protein